MKSHHVDLFHYKNVEYKMENKKYHTVRTIPTSYTESVETSRKNRHP